MTTVLINSIIIQTIDLMNAMQRRGSLKDKCFSQYKNSPTQAHAACTRGANGEGAPRPPEPECGRSCSCGRRPSGKARDGAAGYVWLAEDTCSSRNTRRSAARLGSSHAGSSCGSSNNSVYNEWSAERSPGGQQGAALGIIAHRINPTMARGEITC